MSEEYKKIHVEFKEQDGVEGKVRAVFSLFDDIDSDGDVVLPSAIKSGFDPINANLIKDEILDLREKGATIIFSTHRMESVEELCEDIALINKSNKILDGNLYDIKTKFKSNIYEVGVNASNQDSLNKELDSIFETAKPSFKTIGENLKLNIKLNDKQNSDQLLKILNQSGKVIHFKEVIPSANEIFINSVENN